MNDERIDELIALAALGELSDAEERELDALLTADADLAAEYHDALDTAATVQATASTNPSAELRDRVLGAIAGTPQVGGTDRLHFPDPIGPTQGNVVSLAVHRTRRWMTTLAVAAALLAVVAVGVIVQLDRGGRGGVDDVLSAPDRVERVLAGELGTLRVVHSAQEGALAIVGDDVVTVDDQSTYEAWLVDDAGAIPVGLFRPDEDGDVAVRFDDVDPTGFVVGITREPAGGSEVPTLPILAAA